MTPNQIVHESQGGQSENKDESQRAGDIGRVSWSKELLHILCDLCIQYVEKSKGKNGGVISQRLLWKKIELAFQKKTNLQWDKTKLKNKVDWMRSRWRLWKQLKGKETELGWDHAKGTIGATDEWWDLKIKENSKFEAFREKGLELELEYKMDQIFGLYAQGALKFTPIADRTQGHLQQEDDELHVDDTPHAHLDDMDETYGGNNCYNSNASNGFWRDPSLTPTSTPIPKHQDTQFEGDEQRRGKRVLENESSQSGTSVRVEDNKKGRTTTLFEKLDNLLQLIGDRSNTTKEMNMSIINVLNSMTTPKHEVTDALTKLCALPGLESGTPEFYFTCTLIEDPQKRSILFALPNDKIRVGYIKFLYEGRKDH
ncbi:PREDICTED: uncharacterized protein LOC109180081 [Ipomoea nil]|uniref:uncharacterized protein LOC109180081 n=1 Tax=Ipomoea nil TaxID=35883 RepID=UPI000901B17D|nr:PREDICTED: uncharacterized protein LOC109180081 [Ipomoea nil]